MEKIKCIKITRHGSGASCIIADLEVALQEIKNDWEDEHYDEEVTFSVIEMDKNELEAMSEFEGW